MLFLALMLLSAARQKTYKSFTQGIIGDSYASVGAAATVADNFKFHGVEADYQMDSYFGATHKQSRFGVIKASSMSPRRRLSEGTSVAFPLHASAGLTARPVFARNGKAGRKMI